MSISLPVINKIIIVLLYNIQDVVCDIIASNLARLVGVCRE